MLSARTAMAGAVLLCGLVLAAPAWAHAGAHAKRMSMLGAVNEVRSHHGLAGLRGAPGLNRSATRYARWMLRHDYFGHLARIRASGYSRLGENLAWHSGRGARVRGTVRRWLASPPHRALMLSPSFRWLGSGMAYGNLGGTAATAWVLHFGG